MSDLIKFITINDLGDFEKKIYLITKKEVDKMYSNFLSKLNFIKKEERISINNIDGTIIFSFIFENKGVKRRIIIFGDYISKFNGYFFEELVNSYSIGTLIKRIEDEFLWGAEDFYVDWYIEKKYKIKLIIPDSRELLGDVQNLILNVNTISNEVLEKRISNIIALYEFYFKDDLELYECLTGQRWIDGYTHIYK